MLDGFREAVGDVDAQAARVLEILTDDAKYQRMRTAARHTAESRFDTEKVIAQYEECYRTYLG